MTSLGDGVLTLKLDSTEITNLTTDLEFEIHLLKDKRDPKNRQGTAIPLDRPENNIIFSIGGSKKEISGTARLYDVGDDVSNGTLATAITNDNYRNLDTDPRFSDSDGDGDKDVTTFREQKVWLDEYVNNDNPNAKWTLHGLEFTDFGGTGGGLNVFAAEITPRETPDQPLSVTVDFRLLVGDRT